MLIIAGMTAMTLAGCQRQDEVTVSEPAPVPVPEPAYVVADLALALPDISPSPASTRMASEVVQDGRSRDVTILSITPFEKKGIIGILDLPSYTDGWGVVSSYDNKDENTRKFRYIEKVSFQRGVASMLTYAKAAKNESRTDADAYYGALIPTVKSESGVEEGIPSLVYPSTLKFELKPIYNSEDVPTDARTIAEYLTDIANTKVTVTVDDQPETLTWKNTNGQLKSYYLNFTNQGSAERPMPLAGSARNVKPFVNSLYQDIASLKDKLPGIESSLCEAIMNNVSMPNVEGLSITFNADNKKVTSLGSCDDYPESLGLPDGAAVLQWNNNYDNTLEKPQFEVLTQTTTESNITSIGRYAYPPELYYYGNSLIKTSNTEVKAEIYKNSSTWNTVLGNYEYPLSSDPGGYAVVSGNTKAVAIKDPLQYGVARLNAKLIKTTATLLDAEGTAIPVEANSFPITGIIVSGQFPVRYDFKVIDGLSLSGDSRDTSIERFVYDRYLQEMDGNTDGNTIYLSAETDTHDFNTLLLQSLDYDENDKERSEITVILELLNNQQDFKGENKMIVYKGTKFYLVGKLKLEDVIDDTAYQSLDEDVKKRIFTQDHTTEVAMSINSLARAYNVMPNILSGRLEVSVKIKLKWTEATPSTVILKE